MKPLLTALILLILVALPAYADQYSKEPLRGVDLVKSKMMSPERLKELGLLDRDQLVVSFNPPRRTK